MEREGKRKEERGTMEIHRFLSLLPLGGVYYPEEVLTWLCLTLAISNNIHGFPGTNSYMSLPKGMMYGVILLCCSMYIFVSVMVNICAWLSAH